MDELRLAQMYNYQLSDKQRLQILKEIDVHYCIQDESQPFPRICEEYLGLTFLHTAAKKSYFDCVHELLCQGADLFQQAYCRRTPLHLVFGDFPSPWGLMGVLKHEVANILLSAQVKTGNAHNPVDDNGPSHYHIACAVNHTEAIIFFLKGGVPVNQKVNNDSEYLPGYTALHFAIRYSSLEAAKILINTGADLFLKDTTGRSSLTLVLERLINATDYLNMGKRACCLVCKEEIEKIESIIHVILKSDKANGINLMDNVRLTLFHVACALSDKSFVINYLKQNVNINVSIHENADFWPGYTPLHFAACCNIETFKLLLREGSIITTNTVGKTPIDLCIERYSPEVIHSVLLCKPEFKNILLSDGCTGLLDVLLVMNDCDKFSDFLQSLADVNIIIPHDSPLWPGNTLLHLSIMMNEKTKTLNDFFKKLSYEKSTKARKKFYTCTEKEELAYMKRIVVCLEHGCSLTIKNADGLTPIHLAFNLLKTNVVHKLLSSCSSNVADPNNLTHFHIACAIGDKSSVERFLSQGVDVNSPVRSSFEWNIQPYLNSTTYVPSYRGTVFLVSVRANSTPLHLAVIFEHIEIVDLLLRNGADVYAQDTCGLTPIHLSLNYNTENIKHMPQLLLDNAPNLKEVVSEQNLTHLHVAAYANADKAVEKLLQTCLDVNAVFDYKRQKRENYYDALASFGGETPLYVAVKHSSDKVIYTLICAGASISDRITNGYGDTPFIRALSNLHRGSMKYMIKEAKSMYKESIGPIDENGVTMLHVACATFDLTWAKELLEKGADVNARIPDDESVQWSGMTPLHTLIYEAYMNEKLQKNVMSLVELLLENGADVTIKDSYSSPLYSAHSYAEEFEGESCVNRAMFSSITDLLLNSQKSYDVNPLDYSGLSHVHIACIRNNVKIVERFLDSGIDINHYTDYFSHEDTSGFTSLHFALDRGHGKLARMLISRGANVKDEAANGNTPLHIAVMENANDLEFLEILHRNGADLSAKNLEDMTPLMYLVMLENFTLQQLEFFLERGGRFDATHFQSREGIIGLAMKNAKPTDREIIFDKLIKAVDVTDAIGNGFNAVHSIASVNQNGQLSLDFYIRAITQFMKIGCNLNQQNGKGRAPIHDAVYFHNLEAVKALLLLGANLSVVDAENKSPLCTPVIAENNQTIKRRSAIVTLLSKNMWNVDLRGFDFESPVEKYLFW